MAVQVRLDIKKSEDTLEYDIELWVMDQCSHCGTLSSKKYARVTLPTYETDIDLFIEEFESLVSFLKGAKNGGSDSNTQ